MTNGQKKLPFTQLMVSIMPKKQGIYTLWNRSGKVIFIGIANKPNSLYNELKHHFDSKHSVSIDGIYDFQVNVCNNPEDMQKQLLTVHKNDHGYLPDYNKKHVTPNNIEGNACP